MSNIEQIPAYLTWHIRQQVLYPEMDLEEVKFSDDEDGIHLALFDNNQLISVVSLFKSGTSMQFRKFATIAEYQSRGYGTELLNYLIKVSQTEGCNRVWCNARKNASGFYSKFGFSETDKTFQKNGRDFIIMEKTV